MLSLIKLKMLTRSRYLNEQIPVIF